MRERVHCMRVRMYMHMHVCACALCVCDGWGAKGGGKGGVGVGGGNLKATMALLRRVRCVAALSSRDIATIGSVSFSSACAYVCVCVRARACVYVCVCARVHVRA